MNECVSPDEFFTMAVMLLIAMGTGRAVGVSRYDGRFVKFRVSRFFGAVNMVSG